MSNKNNKLALLLLILILSSGLTATLIWTLFKDTENTISTNDQKTPQNSNFNDCVAAGGELYQNACYMSETEFYTQTINSETESNTTDENIDAFDPQSTFVWTDLSTYNTEKAKTFYTELFGWEFYEDKDFNLDQSYNIALKNGEPAAANFLMPEFFQSINMPSFWMSYIQVSDLESVISKAKNIENAIVEVGPIPFGEGQMALIRDPAGAGFTVYQGPDLNGRVTKPAPGRKMWNIIHVNKLSEVENFYENVFGWTFKQKNNSPGTYEIYNQSNTLIAHLEEFPSNIQGKYRYWVPIIAVENLEQSVAKLKELGGSEIANMTDGRYFVTDDQDAMFMIAETFDTTPSSSPNSQEDNTPQPVALPPEREQTPETTSRYSEAS